MRTVALLAIAAACAIGCRAATSPTRSVTNILVLGNSLTIHVPDATIGWSGNWGMAASDVTKDYAHVLSAKIPTALHVEASLGAFEANYRTFDPASLDSLLQSRPDLVVVEVGDNISDPSEYQAYYAKLLDHLETKTGALILCASTWFGKPPIDAAIRAVCTRPNARFVDLAPIFADPLNHAASERSFSNAGVAGHPGDRGMAAIAGALYDALRQ